MKKKFSQTKNENIKFNTNKPRPEIRDDLNSSSNRGQNKGDDRTHSKKGNNSPGKGK